MWIKKVSALVVVAIVMGLIWILVPPNADSNIDVHRQPDPDNGAMLLQAAGCLACHSSPDNEVYAGGLQLDSPFGNFYSPNITMDSEQGIGAWSLNDFAGAVRQGISPEGDFYYPVMPFTSYQGLTDQDIVDMWIALKQQPDSKQPSQEHDMQFPFNQRMLLKGWRLLFLNTNQVDPSQRGAYLAAHVLHCSECHTPRNILGGLVLSQYFQGNDQLPDENVAPDIRSQALRDKGWTVADLKYLFAEGALPDGDYVGGSMVEVVDFGTSQISAQDRAMLANFVLNQ